MARSKKPKSKLPDVSRAFDQLPTRVFTQSDLRNVFDQYRTSWNLTSLSLSGFIDFLAQIPDFRSQTIPLPHRSYLRYSWGPVTILELLQSISTDAYFSHYTAMQLHNLTEQLPKSVYLNIEQSRKPGGGTLTQAGIDRAFKNKCRISHNKAVLDDYTVFLLNGANTGRLGVTALRAPEGSSEINATNIERTLIDIAVRPIYSGGVFEVAKAYALGRTRASVNKLVAYLRKLNYTYPYHQSIGYYMERAGFSPAQLESIGQFSIEHDFYIDYHLKDVHYNDKWRLYIPKGL